MYALCILANIVGSLFDNIKTIEVTVLAIWCYLNKTELIKLFEVAVIKWCNDELLEM